jgi:hypothetical protein
MSRLSSEVARVAVCGAAVVGALSFARLPSANGMSSAGRVLYPLLADDSSPARADILRSAHGTYIGRLLLDRDSTLDRWPNRVDSAVRVWIEPSAQPGFAGIVRDAFDQWSGAGVPVHFEFVDRARDAEISVRWTDRLDGKTGNTVWRVDDHGWMRSSDVMLATQLRDGRPLDARALTAIALHEVGHALGLAHSDDAHDVMAPMVRVASLSPADRATIRLLYTLPAGHIR